VFSRLPASAFSRLKFASHRDRDLTYPQKLDLSRAVRNFCCGTAGNGESTRKPLISLMCLGVLRKHATPLRALRIKPLALLRAGFPQSYPQDACIAAKSLLNNGLSGIA
jgi:hypothetical protein